MESEILKFIKTARAQGLNDAVIKQKLLASGWEELAIDQALQGVDPLIVPKPPGQPAGGTIAGSNVSVVNQEPVAVVQNMTTRGIEYSIMFLSLWISAIAFGGLLHDMIDILIGESTYPHFGGIIAVTALIVCLPICATLFIRLKSAEYEEASLLKDQSRRKAIQTTLLFSFVIGVLNLIFMVYAIIGGPSIIVTDIASVIFHVIVTIAICGGIFTYYWKDLHRD